MDKYTTAQAARAAGVSYRQLDYWCRAGYVTPSIPAAGYGTRRAWSPGDIERVRRLAARARHRVNWVTDPVPA